MTTSQTEASPVARPKRAPLAELFLRLLGREPGERELEIWGERMRNAKSSTQFVEMLMRAPPIAKRKIVSTPYEPGHPFSPIVNPALVVDYVEDSRRASANDRVAGVHFPLEDMDAFWARQQDFIAATPFPDTQGPDHRYSFLDGPYGYGDGATLRAMISDLRPNRIIEIGSGYSTACMLDTIDELGLTTQITCIEPYPGHLLSRLKPQDAGRLKLIEEGVQGQKLDQFAALENNDILFIDSTHVLKTGSDVHYELFFILPVLKPGVVIHIHDCRYPFEYPDRHIFKRNRSWNEAYAIRALLAYSTRFRPLFSGSFYAAQREDVVSRTFPKFLRNSGSALWIEVLDDGGPYGLDAVGGLQGFDEKAIFKPG